MITRTTSTNPKRFRMPQPNTRRSIKRCDRKIRDSLNEPRTTVIDEVMLPSLQVRRVTICLWAYAYAARTAEPSKSRETAGAPPVANKLVKRWSHACDFPSRALCCRGTFEINGPFQSPDFRSRKLPVSDHGRGSVRLSRETERLLKCSIISFLRLPCNDTYILSCPHC